jgi:uncharacterized lipoprotein YehR (DUF1307 family)
MRLLLVTLLLAFGLAACGERQQVVEQQSEKRYQGKQDGLPWNNEPLAQEYRGGKWTKGDQKSWIEQIKQRQLSQNEDKRIYQ